MVSIQLRRQAVRSARAATAFSLAAVASAAAVSHPELLNALRWLRGRGRCDIIAVGTFAGGTPDQRAAATNSRRRFGGLAGLGVVTGEVVSG